MHRKIDCGAQSIHSQMVKEQCRGPSGCTNAGKRHPSIGICTSFAQPKLFLARIGLAKSSGGRVCGKIHMTASHTAACTSIDFRPNPTTDAPKCATLKSDGDGPSYCIFLCATNQNTSAKRCRIWQCGTAGSPTGQKPSDTHSSDTANNTRPCNQPGG
jgi:hypothetical protein